MTLKELRERLLEAVAKVAHWWSSARYWRGKRDDALRHLADLQEAYHHVQHELHVLKERIDSQRIATPEQLGRRDNLRARKKDLEAAMERTQGRIGNRRAKYRRARKRARFWVVVRTRRRAAFKAAKAKWEQEHEAGYEVWMLNGHSSDIDDDLKPVVAFLVVARGQTITDTYDYCCHTPTSLHYPRNDPTPPQQGRAVDSAGGDIGGSEAATLEHFGAGKFLELFGPNRTYVKNGLTLDTGGGAFPGHDDHQHSGVA